MVDEDQNPDYVHDYGPIESGRLTIDVPPAHPDGVSCMQSFPMTFGMPAEESSEESRFGGTIEIEYDAPLGVIRPSSLEKYIESYTDCRIDPAVVADFVRDDIEETLHDEGQEDPDVFVRLDGKKGINPSASVKGFTKAGRMVTDTGEIESSIETWTSSKQ